LSFKDPQLIRSPDNQKLKTIRKLQQKRWRRDLGMFAAEGEDLVTAAADAGWEPVLVLRSGEDVEPALLEEASTLGSGARVIGVYKQRWVEPSGRLSVYLHGVSDPGNVGTIIRSAHALADGPVVIGPGCADPYSPKAVRASMGSIFARPPARGGVRDLSGQLLALDAKGGLTLSTALDGLVGSWPAPLTTVAGTELPAVDPSADGEAADDVLADESPTGITLCLGAEREGLPADVLQWVDVVAGITLREDGPDSLNVAMAATIGLYEVANRMRAHG
jgi:TrmH family RNA methyltransferase